MCYTQLYIFCAAGCFLGEEIKLDMYGKRKINKILIVDDSEMNRAILADMLGKAAVFHDIEKVSIFDES